MQLANCWLEIGNGSDVPLRGVTPAQVMVLVKGHSDRAKKCAVRDIEIIGEAAVIEVAEVSPETDKNGKVLKEGVPAKLRLRTDLEELARLKTLYHEARILEVFPKGTTKVPQTFDEARETWKPVPQVEADRVGNWTNAPLPKLEQESVMSKGKPPAKTA